MHYLNGWHPFESIRFDLVKVTMWRCLVLQIWEQEKQLLRNQRVIQLYIVSNITNAPRSSYCYLYIFTQCGHTGSPVLIDSRPRPRVSQTYLMADDTLIQCKVVMSPTTTCSHRTSHYSTHTVTL